MSDHKPSTPNTGLTIKPTHFPKIILVSAASVWGLSVLGAILEVIAH